MTLYRPTSGTLNDRVLTILQDAKGELGNAEVIAQLEVDGHGAFNASSVGAALSQLRARREDTGVVRTGPGTYLYSPGNLDLDQGDVPNNKRVGGTIAPRVLGALSELGEGRASEVRDMVPDLTIKQVNQVLASADKNGRGVERVELGVYRWTGEIAVPKARPPKPSPNGHMSGLPVSNPELVPILDELPVDAFETVGLKSVAKTKDGDFICIDEQGTAWAVTITITSKLL